MGLKGFNLLQDNTAPPDMWDKIYDWVSRVGRAIVIFVEIIVILSFGARVVIDTQAKDLEEQEQQLNTTLVALRQSENNYRDMQDRFRNYKDIWGFAATYSEIFTNITDERPNNLDELRINIQDRTINFRGSATLREIGSFEETLKASEDFELVEVFEVESESGLNDSRTQASFGIRIIVKPELIRTRDTSWQT
jgi:hypothetical protein